MDTSSKQDKKIKEGFVGQRMIVLPPNIKNTMQTNELIKAFYLTAIGYYPLAAYHDRERKVGSQQYILLYCVEGKGNIYIYNREYELYPNSYFIIPKAVPHHYQSSKEDPWSIYWAHFVGQSADALYIRYTHGKDPEVMPVPYDEKLVKLFDEVITMLETSLGERELEIANLNFLHFISCLIYHKEINPFTYATDAVTDSIRFMQANLHSSFTLKELASQQHLSISYYSELFKKKTGYSPIQYFIQLKIQKSCQYLYFTNRSVKEICTELGFDDPFYYSRIFKKTMGLSPKKYRDMHKR